MASTTRKGKTGADSAGARRAPASKQTTRKPARRRIPKPEAGALEVDAEVLEFIEAMDGYKQQNSRPFPTWSEVLFVLKSLGYSR